MIENGSLIDQRFARVRSPRVHKAEWVWLDSWKTEFLLVDAAMGELVAAGFIGNRARLLLAPF